MRCIFDLDHTVIDSSHRQLTLANGSLDLDHWRENCTREKILADKLLPLAEHWKDAKAKGAEIVICTARVMGTADYEFLFVNGLQYDAILSRNEGDTTPDHLLKYEMLRDYADHCGISWRRFKMFSVMFDDNKNVIDHLTANGLKVYNAIKINERAVA